jgi:hypothetical protein
MKKNNGFVCFVAAGVCSLVSVPSDAESGTVDIVLSANSNVYAVQMGDMIVTARGGNGTVTFFHSSGRPFVEGASAMVQYAGFSKKTPSGLELEADCVAAGVNGQCKYKMDDLPGKWNVSIAKCQWLYSFPYR